MSSAFETLLEVLVAGRSWEGTNEKAKALLEDVFRERFHSADWALYQTRSNLEGKDAASYAGYITADNPTSGGYSGTSFVWMPGERGSVAVLVIGTQGFGSDASILARPGHRRRLEALARLHGRALWVKPDVLDRSARVPEVVSSSWPEIKKALQSYGDVIYAAVPVRDVGSREVVEDLLTFYFHEHRTRTLKTEEKRWSARRAAITSTLFPKVSEAQIADLVKERRFVVLEGPPGTGKTRAAERVAARLGTHTTIQFHPARTYEDFVVGLAPTPAAEGLRFDVRPGDLIRANQRAKESTHTLVIDEINRADLSKVLGEAMFLFEPGEARTIDLPHAVQGERAFSLSPQLFVIGTRNTADRTIARMDLAIRRRFAFLTLWPDAAPVVAQGDPLALECFEDTLQTFADAADDEALVLVPGHAYFLDVSPDPAGRAGRLRRRMRHELVPLLREYAEARLVGPATGDILGLLDRVETRLDQPS